jgi:MFS transporter, DHA2 family, multidrug resistance protein
MRAKIPLEPMQGGALGFASIALSLASFMQVLDQTVANVSIPTIAGSLGVSPTQGTWVITSFAVSSAISVPLTGWLAQRIGQVRLFLIATSVFVVASFLCGMAASLGMLVTARVLQGAVAGPMAPLGQALLLSIYPPAKRLAALTLSSMVVVTAPIFGPLLGGWISDNWTWPWIFFINIPLGVLAVFVISGIFKGRDTPIQQAPIDTTGLFLLASWVGSLQIVLDKGKDEDWFNSPLIITLSVISVVTFCYFLIWELTARHPVVELKLFKQRNFVVATLALSLGFAVFFGLNIIMPLWLQTQMGYTAQLAGLVAAPVGLFPLLMSPLVRRGLSRFDPRLFATVAFLSFSVSAYMRSNFTTNVDMATVMAAQIMAGFGVAFFMVPLTSIMLSGMPGEKIASASGLSNFIRITFASFSASIATTLWERRDAVHHSQLAASISNWNPNTAAVVEQLREGGMSQSQSLAILERLTSNQSSLLGAIDYFRLAAWILLATGVFLWLTKPPFTQLSGPVEPAD